MCNAALQCSTWPHEQIQKHPLVGRRHRYSTLAWQLRKNSPYTDKTGPTSAWRNAALHYVSNCNTTTAGAGNDPPERATSTDNDACSLLGYLSLSACLSIGLSLSISVFSSLTRPFEPTTSWPSPRRHSRTPEPRRRRRGRGGARPLLGPRPRPRWIRS